MSPAAAKVEKCVECNARKGEQHTVRHNPPTGPCSRAGDIADGTNPEV